jgi:hypothetical protein
MAAMMQQRGSLKMNWGVFETDDNDILHVAPCNDEGHTTHILNEQCPCHPWYDQERGAHGTRPLLVHEQIQ